MRATAAAPPADCVRLHALKKKESEECMRREEKRGLKVGEFEERKSKQADDQTAKGRPMKRARRRA